MLKRLITGSVKSFILMNFKIWNLFEQYSTIKIKKNNFKIKDIFSDKNIRFCTIYCLITCIGRMKKLENKYDATYDRTTLVRVENRYDATYDRNVIFTIEKRKAKFF